LNLRSDIPKIKDLANWCFRNIGNEKDIKVNIYKANPKNIVIKT
jgi:hypothetical protein